MKSRGRNRRPGLLRPDYSEKSQSRRTSTSSAGVKVDVTLAPGLQVKDPSKRPKSATSLDVFRDSAAAVGALSATWAKLPQSLVFHGEDKGWRKITKRCKDFLIGREPKIRKNTQGKT